MLLRVLGICILMAAAAPAQTQYYYDPAQNFQYQYGNPYNYYNLYGQNNGYGQNYGGYGSSLYRYPSSTYFPTTYTNSYTGSGGWNGITYPYVYGR